MEKNLTFILHQVSFQIFLKEKKKYVIISLLDSKQRTKPEKKF